MRWLVSVLGIVLLGAMLARADTFQPDLSGLTSAINALQDALPAHCSATPAPDSLLGSVTSGNCYTSASDTRPTVVQAAIAMTDSTGAWSVTWAKAFSTTTPYANSQAINVSGTQPYVCNVASSTATTASGKCWQTTTATLPTLASSLLGLVINPTGTSGVIQVRIAARDVTQ